MLGLSSWITPRNHLANLPIFYTFFYFCQEYFCDYNNYKNTAKLQKLYKILQKFTVLGVFLAIFFVFFDIFDAKHKNWQILLYEVF